MIKAMRCGVVAWCLAGIVAQAAEVTLKVGSPAPKLLVAKWVQGEAVKGFETNKAYIVEFWATWCGPCRETIPHLNEIHKKYKDKGLVVIGQDLGEEEAEVAKFVKEMGDKMTYRVALEQMKGDTGLMGEAWLEAAGQGGIPTAFVVAKTGEIAWIGHPASMKEEMLEQVLAGTFDVKKAALAYTRQQEQDSKVEVVFEDFKKAAGAQEWDKAEGFLKDWEKILDESERPKVDMVRLQMNMRKGDLATAETVARRLAEHEADNAQYHAELAWVLATQKAPPKSLIELAEKEANRAREISKGANADILDTLARVQFVKGDKEAAVATQQKALELAEPKAKPPYEKTLNAYKSGKLEE